VAFWFTLVGFYVTFMPLYAAGLLGMTRRMQHYDVAAWRPWMIVAAIGTVLLTIGVITQAVQLAISIRRRHELRDATGDPWDGRSLEWATASPPPVFNFAVSPDVAGEDAYWTIKSKVRQQEIELSEPDYRDIEMPRNSPTGFVCAFFATVMGFALIWHIWWMVILGGIGAFATFVAFAWRDHDEYVVPADEVARLDRINLAERRAALNLAGSHR
jgi:cytochrome o ubiquinol oxidase subunit I